MAKLLDVEYYETSAQTGENVNIVFEKLAEDLMKIIQKREPQVYTDSTFDYNQPNKKKKCC